MTCSILNSTYSSNTFGGNLEFPYISVPTSPLPSPFSRAAGYLAGSPGSHALSQCYCASHVQ